MSQEMIAQRLKQAIGLHSETVGMITISNAINRRMTERGLRSYSDYLALIDAHPGELQELIEAVIIPETWFFRDDSPYVEIVKYIKRRLSEEHISQLNILSIPCSTGEEPYSIAIALEEAHISPDLYRISAIDISQRNVDKAIKATYRKNSFRSSRDDFIGKYFQEKDDCYQLCDRIRLKVNFQQGNILDDNLLVTEPVYDVIFCRNLLIYFDKPTQNRVFVTLHKLLKDDGILVLGHAETHHSSGNLFEHGNKGISYIYKKCAAIRPETNIQSNTIPETTTNRPSRKKQPQPTTKPFAAVNKHVDKPVYNHVDIDKAFTLANEGNIEEAKQLCMDELEQDSSNYEAYYLLGVIHDTCGESDRAEEFFRKTVYLSPNHYEALVHLSLMLEQSGDIPAANRFRQRAQKAQERSEADS